MKTSDPQAVCMFCPTKNKTVIHSYRKLSNRECADRKWFRDYLLSLFLSPFSIRTVIARAAVHSLLPACSLRYSGAYRNLSNLKFLRHCTVNLANKFFLVSFGMLGRGRGSVSHGERAEPGACGLLRIRVVQVKSANSTEEKKQALFLSSK